MAWPHDKRLGSKKDAWSIEEPSSKKRKVGSEEAGDEWGNDSLELTQAEIESLDVIASQVLGSSQMQDQSTSAGLFARPPNPSHLSSHSNRLSSSSSVPSSDSSHRPKSSSLSLSSGSSLNSISSHSSASNGSSVSLPPKPHGKKLEAVTEIEAELEKRNQEIKDVREEKYRSDGEVKYLRQTLQKKEAEIEQMRVQKNADDEQWKKRQVDKERKLKLQVDKLMSEAHFKEREYQESMQVLEKKLKEKEEKQKPHKSETSPALQQSQEATKISSPQKKTVKPSPPSKLRQQQKGDDSLSSSQFPEFPTQSSFMERPQGQSPKARTSLVLKQTKSVSCQAETSSCESPKKVKSAHPKRTKMRRLQLRTESADFPSGPAIVSDMIRPCGTSASEGDPGLVGLLQALSTSHTVDSLSYSRNKDNSFLSPLKPKRVSHLLGSVPSVSGVQSSSGSSVVRVVSPDHFHLAIQGLDMLLHTHHAQDGLSASPIDQDPLYGSILLLPMLSDYLHHYLHHTVAKGASSGMYGSSKSPNTTPDVSHIHKPRGQHPSRFLPHPGSSASAGVGVDSVSLYTTASSGSYDSSFDSLNSSVLQLLQEGKLYAATVEKYALSAMQCLSLLIQLCPIVTSVLVHSSLMESKGPATSDGEASSKQAAGMESSQKKVESGTDADDEKSTSSSEVRIIASINSIPRLASLPTSSTPSLHNQSRLMVCMATLAAENLQESNVSPQVVEESLRALNHLCRHCNAEEFLRLEHVIMKEGLSHSLRQTKHPQILVEAQRLCGQLIHHPNVITRLCTKSENCPLYHMYRLCADSQVNKLHLVSTQIYSQHINILSSIITQHRSGLSSLLLNVCACTDELIIGTILAMYKLFKTFKQQQSSSSSSSDSTLLPMLLQGILVLHCLAQADGAFCQRHNPVQLSYVRLLTGLAEIIKPIRSQWEWHATVLDELCDFEPEFHESSPHDSENEDKMDHSS